MRMYYITFRSVTLAQQAQRLLHRAGIPSSLQRTPRKLQDRGCGFCLRLRPGDTEKALELFRSNSIPFSQVYAGATGRMEVLQL